jgi:ribosome-associated protein
MRASGPGGQNVNKVATAVMLRFDLHGGTCLPTDVRTRLERLAGKRLSQEGVLVITARRHRTQERNRAEALAALVHLVRRASVPPVKRVPTRPSKASVTTRLETKATARPHQGRPEPRLGRRIDRRSPSRQFMFGREGSPRTQSSPSARTISTTASADRIVSAMRR